MVVQCPMRYLLQNEGFLVLNGNEANWHLLPLYPSILELSANLWFKPGLAAQSDCVDMKGVKMAPCSLKDNFANWEA